ncbi:MAG: hypothetical protein COU10_03505 [Candidatus Harrisonbacteria bacterium CG10_big_fil_rev_8_21_14_0_10_45_28]|uniref:Uncharacterized protein n=1 Tax=Candidatus Harrisonbacteria bacterium CG10_big_fil_rev_8_21_14_0_10_45_28 TaxID=1974586 RepID=A0A2H0UPE6_9BACT|nr:MAG: hypothetical protein COU10_03505 [Candidatus Harrisonbacteria bacterium CG10_big_fil_rev_8_21_14_0_10_45_28]
MAKKSTRLYDVTHNGRIEVDVKALVRDPRTQQIAKTAHELIQAQRAEEVTDRKEIKRLLERIQVVLEKLEKLKGAESS